MLYVFFFSSRRRHTRWPRDWSSDVCSSDLLLQSLGGGSRFGLAADDLLEGGARGVGEGRGGVVEVGQQGALGGDGVEGLGDVHVDPRVGGEVGRVVDGRAAVRGDRLPRLGAGA